MNPLVWLSRASRCSRRPPSARRVVLVLAVVAICLALAGIERLFGWPRALGVNPPNGRALKL